MTSRIRHPAALLRFALSLLAATCPTGAHAHGAYHDVVRELTPWINQSPTNAALRFRLACAHLEHEEWPLAIEELARVDQIAPGQFPTALARGRAYAGQRHWAAAKAELDRALEYDPIRVEAFLERAIVRLELKDIPGAIADGRQAFELGKEAAPEQFLRWVEALQRHQQTNEAARIVRQGLTRFSRDIKLLTLAVDLEAATGQYDAALAHADTLRALWPRPEPWMRRRALLLAEAGRAEAAQQVWRQLLDHLESLPNLERGQPFLLELQAEARQALGWVTPRPVNTPPATAPDGPPPPK